MTLPQIDREINKRCVLVVIPAFNAATYLHDLIQQCRQFVCNDNLLVVNDGSTDKSQEILQKENVNHITFPNNCGKGAALLAGFQFAESRGYRSVLTLDADLQHPPESIPQFYALDDGKTVVIGTRDMNRAIMPIQRQLSNFLTSIVISIFSTQRIRDSQSGFRLIPVDLIRSMPLDATGYDLESELLFKAGALGYRIVEVPIKTVYAGSRSNIRPVADTLRFIRQIWRRIWL